MIRDNIQAVRRRITEVCRRIGRDPSSITIVAVSKGRTPAEIEEAISCGITDIGENRVQEAVKKFYHLPFTNYRLPKMHLVGHLQTNKAKQAVKLFALIHSVDSLRLAEELDKQAAKIGKIQDILIEVNTSGEKTKFGLKPEETISAIKQMHRLKNIRIQGLMTIAPMADEPEKTRPSFRLLKQLLNKFNQLPITDYQLPILSMGMTDDFEVAIEEGANMVRLGRAIFRE